MSCAWNNYCIAVRNKLDAIKAMRELSVKFEQNPESPVLVMLADMLKETSLYYYLDGLVFERDNYITLIGEDLERNGDCWIFYMAQSIRDNYVFDFLKEKGTFAKITPEEMQKMMGGTNVNRPENR